MPGRFTFDGALMFGFRAAYVRSFPWKFALAFAIISTVLTALLVYLTKDILLGFIDSIDKLDSAGVDDPAVFFDLMFGMFVSLAPWGILATLVSLAVWAMFMTATQRRYIRDEDFSLGFGADEVRMMGTGFVWYLGLSLMGVLPLLIMLPVFGEVMEFARGEVTENEMVTFVMGRVAYLLLVMLVTFPVYVFFATRFSPVFAMTLKDGKIAFGDAWIVSRGRFWPIHPRGCLSCSCLGAYLIVAIVGGMAVGFVFTFVEMLVSPALMLSLDTVGDVPELLSLFTPGVIAAMLAYTFIRYFLSALLMHFVQAPAAFAARHDPRGSVDDALRISEFE